MRYGCPITTDDGNLIIAGGQFTWKNVLLYDRGGYVMDLANLNTKREYGHACGHYRNNDGETVKITLF